MSVIPNLWCTMLTSHSVVLSMSGFSITSEMFVWINFRFALYLCIILGFERLSAVTIHSPVFNSVMLTKTDNCLSFNTSKEG